LIICHWFVIEFGRPYAAPDDIGRQRLLYRWGGERRPCELPYCHCYPIPVDLR
jgi:hypothetical protein